MRVLVLSQSFAPVFEGGTERVARAQARALRALGHDVHVIAAAPADQVGRVTVEGLAVDFVEEDFPPGDLNDAIAQRLWLERPTRRAAVLAIVDAEAQKGGAFELVLIEHQASLSLGLVPALQARGARVIVALHDLFVTCARFFRDPPAGITCPGPGETLEACATCVSPEAPGAPAELLLAAVTERARRFRQELSAADLLIAPSASHARRLSALLDLAPIHVVPNGLLTDLSPAREVKHAPLTVLHFGHRVRTKGVVELVRAAESAAQRGAELRLILMGTELEAGLADELLGLADSFDLELFGAYERAELERVATRCQLAAFPSKALESYGLVVDEALALGLPALVSDTGDGATPGALAERLGGAGLALPRPVDAAGQTAWSDALHSLAREIQEPGQGTRLTLWTKAIPSKMPGPREAVLQMLSLLPPIVS